MLARLNMSQLVLITILSFILGTNPLEAQEKLTDATQVKGRKVAQATGAAVYAVTVEKNEKGEVVRILTKEPILAGKVYPTGTIFFSPSTAVSTAMGGSSMEKLSMPKEPLSLMPMKGEFFVAPQPMNLSKEVLTSLQTIVAQEEPQDMPEETPPAPTEEENVSEPEDAYHS